MELAAAMLNNADPKWKDTGVRDIPADGDARK